MRIPPRAEVMAAVREQEAAMQRARYDQERERAVINLQMALLPAKVRHFEFRGRKFGVPPIPWERGARLLDAWDRFASLTPDADRDEAVSCVEEIVALFRECARPDRWIHRLTYRLRNPFRDCTLAELQDTYAFFLICKRRDDGLSPEEIARRLRSTSPTPSSDLPRSAPPGSEKADTPAPGSTSRSSSGARAFTAPRMRSGGRGTFGQVRHPATTGRSGRPKRSASSDGEVTDA